MPHVPAKPWLVQKFGGTSVGKLLPSITSNIIPSYLRTHNVAVVCSARSSTSKSKGTTSLLLDAIRLATCRDSDAEDANNIVNVIEEDHLEAAREAIGLHVDGPTLLRGIQEDIRRDCEQLRNILAATAILGETSEKTMDRVLAMGETLSCRIVAASLASRDVPAKVVILDDIVQQAYSGDDRSLLNTYRARPAEFLHGLATAIRTKIGACGGKVPIITGFFGAIPGGLIASVSRGYSDLCAALCAVALGAEEMQIWKEVDGVFTADPRKIKAARLLPTITSEEAAELTYYGSEVIHPLTIEQINGAEIPLRLKNVRNPEGHGTIIYPSQQSSPTSPGRNSPIRPLTPASDNSAAIAKASFMTANGYYGPNQCRRSPTAITVKEGIVILNVRSHGTASPQKFLSSVSDVLEAHSITVDLTTSSQQMLSLAICAPKPSTLKDLTLSLEASGTVDTVKQMSIVSVVGHKMRNMVGIAAEIFAALASARVNIYLISQGASEINISFVVRAQDAQLAMEVVHTNVMRIPLHEDCENAFVKGPWLY